MIKELEIQKPYISSFPIYGDLFSILEQTEHVKNWMCNNFIQLKYVDPVIFFESYRSLIYDCPHIATSCITRDLIRKIWDGDFRKLVKYVIGTDRYLFAYVDRKYIKKYNINFSNEHEIFIYGYDDDNDMYLCADYLEYSQYIKFEVPMSELEEAYWKVQENNYFSAVHCISVIKSPPENNWFESIKMRQIYELFSAYAESRPTLNFGERFDIKYYGFKLHSFMVDKIVYDDEFLDWRSFCVFGEHKKMMAFRLSHIGETYLTDDFNKYIYTYKKLYKVYRRIVLLIIKYNISHNKNTISSILKYSKEAMDTEEAILDELKNLLYKYSLRD